jgi:phosphoribosyl 1,2-cyclic phosphodiesterase
MARQRRSRQLDDLPGLFDDLEIDISREDIAGNVIDEHEQRQRIALKGGKSASTPSSSALDDDLELVLEKEDPTDKLMFISFGSGSSGNCSYIGTGKFGFLIDAGVDYKHVTKELEKNGIDIKGIRGILVTHDHGDHVRYAYSMLSHNKHMLLYCTPKTLSGILMRHNLSRRIKDYHKAFYKEFEFTIDGFTIIPFEVSHDGTDNVGFYIQYGNHHFVIATDTGYITERADYYLRKANYVMIESNYDHEMLINGDYKEYLKARIISDKGHLDNKETARYISGIYTPQLTHVFLCHLSHDNNTPEIALSTMREALISRGVTVGDASDSLSSRNADVQVVALPRFESSPLYVLRYNHD